MWKSPLNVVFITMAKYLVKESLPRKVAVTGKVEHSAFVGRKTGGWKVCVDDNRLNKNFRKNRINIPEDYF